MIRVPYEDTKLTARTENMNLALGFAEYEGIPLD